MLTTQQLTDYHKHGFLIVENYATRAEVNSLRNRIQIIISESQHNENAIFSTLGNKETDIEYFLSSGDKIRCFFEEESDQDQQRVVNKVGHALHDLDPVFESFSYQKKLGAIARQLGHDRPTIIQSQYIFKSPGVGGEVVPHTDSTFLYTEPETCIGAWIALEDATESNGCMWAIPGSHKTPLQERYILDKTTTNTKFIALAKKTTETDLTNKVPLIASAGTLVLIHGRVVHFSEKNTSEYSRHAYIMHLIDAIAKYPSNNWLQRAFPLRNLQ